MIGLDIDSLKTRLVHLKGYRGKYELVDYISIDTPAGSVDNGIITRPQLLGEKIGAVIKEHKLQGKRTISALLGSQIYIKNLVMPKMKLNELRQATYYEATTFLPIPVEESVIDIFPLRNFESDTGPKTEVFFAAARRNQVENLEETCKIAGLNLKVVDLEPLAINRILAEPENIKTKALLNIEASRSSFSVFEEENLLFHRSLSVGTGLDLEQAVSNDYFMREVLTDVLRSIEYYNIQFQAYPEVIMVCGYGSKLAELRDLLSENIDTLVMLGQLNSEVIIPEDLDEANKELLLYEYLTALGLAIRGGV